MQHQLKTRKQEFQKLLPLSEEFPTLLQRYFRKINTTLPIIHPATFDPANASWELTLALLW